MNNKIKSLIVFFIILVFSTYTTSAIYTNSTKNFVKNNQDVPIWNVGDYWKYHIDNLIIESEEMGLNINIELDNFIVEVIEDTGDSYKLEFSALIKGGGTIQNYIGYEDPIEIEIEFGKLLKSKIKGEAIRSKTNLGLEQLKIELSALIKIKMTENPLINFPIPSLRIPFKITIETEFSEPYTIIEYPLEINNNWATTTTTISIKNVIFQCPLLRPINFINKIINIFNLIPEEYQHISDLLSEMLPIINIKDILDNYGINTTYQIPASPVPIFFCQELTDINIEAGIFEAYKISVMTDIEGNNIEYGEFYYSPEAGRIIKFNAYTEIISEIILTNYGINLEISNINFELEETNYS
jgi:hypothetical protein